MIRIFVPRHSSLRYFIVLARRLPVCVKAGTESQDEVFVRTSMSHSVLVQWTRTVMRDHSWLRRLSSRSFVMAGGTLYASSIFSGRNPCVLVRRYARSSSTASRRSSMVVKM